MGSPQPRRQDGVPLEQLDDLDKTNLRSRPADLQRTSGKIGARRILKSAYGLAEVPLAWYLFLDAALLKVGFRRMSSDCCQ